MSTLKPMAFDPARLQRMQASLAKQNPRVSAFNRSNDPEHFPVFSTPKTGVYLVYVPNHFSLDPETEQRVLQQDNVFLHRVNDGSRFGTQYRCVQGIVSPEDGFDGSCPLCEAAQESFDWYNKAIELREAQYGRAIKGAEDNDAKSIRQHLLEQRPVYLAEDRHVFPIVVIECDQKKYTPKVVDGNVAYKVYWYECSGNQYAKLEEALKLQEDQCPAGKLFLFDYTYDTKGKEPTARDAARNLSITLLPDSRGFTPEHFAKFDELTQDWTPAKAIETVKISAFYSVEQYAGLANTVMNAKRVELQSINRELASLSTAAHVGDVPAPAPALPASDEAVEVEVVPDSEDATPDATDVNSILGGGFAI